MGRGFFTVVDTGWVILDLGHLQRDECLLLDE